MKRILYLLAAALATVSITAACGSGPHRSVTGTLIRVGGPAAIGTPSRPVPLPGQIVARDGQGRQFTADAGSDGQFRLSLPPGTYRVTGNSPQIDDGKAVCAAAKPVSVTMTAPVTRVMVICSIS